MKCLVCKINLSRKLCDPCEELLCDKYPDRSLQDIMKIYEDNIFGDEE